MPLSEYTHKLHQNIAPDALNDLTSWADAIIVENNQNHTQPKAEKHQVVVIEYISENERVGLVRVDLFALDWARLSKLTVAEAHRGKGVGVKLLQMAEEYVRDDGRTGVILDTVAFQAPQFYLDRGYEVYGELANFAGEHSCIYMKKVF